MRTIGLAHRGYPAKYPENTMPSFQAAIDLSFSHLELDVNMTRDGIPVVIHDPTVDRTTNGKGLVKDYTLHELQRLRTDNDHYIPTLKEVLELAKDRIKVDIELKQSGDLYQDIEKNVLEVIQACKVQDQVFVSSFDHYSIMKMRQLSGDIDLGLVIYGATPSVFPLAEQINARYVSVKYIYLTDHFVQKCDEQGIQIIAWTVDDKHAMKQIYDKYSNVWVCTNELEKWANVCQL